MDGRERIIAALEIREPDRVPLFIHGINEEPIIGIGRHITEGLPEPKEFRAMDQGEKVKLLDTLFRIHEEFEVDGFTAFEIGDTRDVDGDHVTDDFNVVYRRSTHGIPVPCGHPLREREDLAGYRPPSPKEEHLLLLKLAKNRFGTGRAIFWMMRGSFVKSWRLAGMENLMIKMYDDPQFVHDLAAMVLEYNLAQLEMVAGAGADVLIVEDDIADKSATLISPSQFREFVNPYNRRLVEEAHKKGMKAVRHSDGNLWPIMDILLDTGYDGLNPLEPQAGMTLKGVKEYCGDRLCLLGNIDCVDLLPRGTAAQVEEAVRLAIDDAAKGGGYILCDSNSLHPGVNPENCIAMFRAVHKYGVYGRQPA
jgi:uroporphyrinogen decarboxylase